MARRGFLYEFSLLWVFPVAWSGYRRKIEDADRVPDLPEEIKAENLVPKAIEYWNDELKKEKPSISNVIFRLSKCYVWMGLLMSVIQGLTTTVLRPLLIRLMVLELNGEADEKTLLIYVGYLALSLVVEAWSSVSLKHALSDYLGTIWFTSAATLIHRKSLRIPGGLTQVGESSLIGNDLLRVYENQRFASIMPMAFISLIGGIVVLIITIGKSSIVGLACMAFILICNARIAKKSQKAEEEDLEACDARLGIVTQIIMNIKAIKLSAWEESFTELVRKARKVEMKWLEVYRTLHQTSVQLGRACPAVCAAVSFVFMALLAGEDVNAADLFAALNVFLALRLPLIVLPESLVYVLSYMASAKRIQEYLMLEEVEAGKCCETLPHDSDLAKASSSKPPLAGTCTVKHESEPEVSDSIVSIHINNSNSNSNNSDARESPDTAEVKKGEAEKEHHDQMEQFYYLRGTYAWPGSAMASKTVEQVESTISFRKEKGEQLQISFHSFALENLDLKIPKRSKTAIISKVGGGKSSLLHCLMGEMKEISQDPEAINTFSNVPIKGYVPQTSFVLSGTLRDNIKFGNDNVSESLLNEAIEKSAFVEDLEHFPDKLETAVGERGVTLSGGQKVRIGIARAYAQSPEVFIADDPLAAVDPAVAEHLVEHIIRGKAPETTIIIGLNQLNYLKEFDYVIQLNNGSVKRFEKVTPELIDEINSSTEFVHKDDDADDNDREDDDEIALLNSIEKNENELLKSPTGGSSVASEERILSSSLIAPEHVEGQEPNELVRKEFRSHGTVGGHVIFTYIKGMGLHNFALGISLGLVTYSIMAWNDLWLADFAKIENPTYDESIRFAVVYGVGCLGFLLFLVVTSIVFSRAGVRSSQYLHDMAMDRIMHAPIDYFESTPSGRFISRMSTDIGIVDQVLSRFTDNLFQLFATVLALTVVVCVIVPPVTLVIALCGILFTLQVIAVDVSMREIKREAQLAMSPIQTLISESVNGKVCLRAMLGQQPFIDRFQQSCDAWNRQSFTSLSMVNMSMLSSYMLSFFVSTATGVFLVLGNQNPADAGLALTYSLLIPYFLLHCAFVYTIVANALTSLERILHFISAVPQEPDWRLDSDPQTYLRAEKEQLDVTQMSETDFWPSKGNIEFQKVSLIYRPGLPPALKKMSFKINSGERIGICGRSGAGKSSLLSVLLRIVEPTSGKILIDGVDTSQLGLLTLREAFGMVPQEPLLLNGTIRKNMSPFADQDSVDDAILADALMRTGLANSMEDALNLLDLDVGSGASSLSAGTKQLLSFARTLLRPGAIRILDEPSSNIDMENDAKLQRVLRQQPAMVTLVVAHRLLSIVDSDRVLVVDKGTVAEFDTPQNLLSNPNSLFFAMSKAHDAAHC